jgi:hypothetical protein
MIKLATDENFNGKILRGVLRRQPNIDIVRVQDTSIYQADDPTVLAWAAQENRVLFTHDIRTMAAFAFQRIEQGLPMSGLFQVDQTASVNQIIEDMLLLATCSLDGEWEGQIRFLPL